MFGYKARHIKSSMMMESTPDACNQSHMKMEIDGWYADLSAGFSCANENYRALACGGPGSKPGCTDRFVMKGSATAALGYPLKQTTTMISDQGTFTMTTEVLEISNTSLEEPLFDMPPGCRVMDMSALAGSAPPTPPSAPAAEVATRAPAAHPVPAIPSAPAPAPVAPKTTGVVRVGVVKIKDMTGQSMPTDNLRLNLISEIERNKMEAVPLDTEAPYADVEAEARAKQCDYIVFTVPSRSRIPTPAACRPRRPQRSHARFCQVSGPYHDDFVQGRQPAARTHQLSVGRRCQSVSRGRRDGDVRRGVRQDCPASCRRCPSETRGEDNEDTCEDRDQAKVALGWGV